MKYCDITKDKILYAKMKVKSRQSPPKRSDVNHDLSINKNSLKNNLKGGIRNGIKRRSSKTTSIQASEIKYQFRFYVLIILLLASTFFYVHHQIVNVSDSVFANIYQLIQAQIEKSREAFLTKSPAPAPAPAPAKKKLPDKTKQKNITIKENIDKTKSSQVPQKDSSTSQDVAITKNKITSGIFTLYYPKMNMQKNSVELVAVPRKIARSHGIGIHNNNNDTHYYVPIIHAMLQNKTFSTNFVKPFQSDVSLKKAWVEDDVLLLDFNQLFADSRYGDKGTILQIQQIIWTLFHLQNPPNKFNFVSFLIEGKRQSKLGVDTVCKLKLSIPEKILKKKSMLKITSKKMTKLLSNLLLTIAIAIAISFLSLSLLSLPSEKLFAQTSDSLLLTQMKLKADSVITIKKRYTWKDGKRLTLISVPVVYENGILFTYSGKENDNAYLSGSFFGWTKKSK